MLANFQAEKGGYHVVPNAEVRSKLPPGLRDDPTSPYYDHVKLASEVGFPDTLVNTDKNNFSPRVGFAYRLDPAGKTVWSLSASLRSRPVMRSGSLRAASASWRRTCTSRPSSVTSRCWAWRTAVTSDSSAR